MERYIVNKQHNTEHHSEQDNPVQDNDHKGQGFSRRSFFQLAGTGGLAMATGCTGNPTGGEGWIPEQYNNIGNFPVQVRGRIPIDPRNLTIMRDDQKCILCGQCAEVCDRYQAVMGHYELPLIDFVPCIGCGQCTLWCPTSSITERDDTQRLFEALKDPDVHVVVQTAPSTRIGLGEEFGLPAGTNVEGKQVAALRELGVDTVLDTNFAADLTVMEEATELVQRLKTEGAVLPMFTSCCPSWVLYCEAFYPELLPNLSTARSPMGMLGPMIKTYYAEKRGIDPEKIVSVAVMPCTAKKFEAARPEMNNAGRKQGNPEMRDTNIVITTRELARMIKQEKIDFPALPDGSYDDLLSEYSGGGAIFGATGGVMEAAVRTAYFFVTKENPPPSVVNFKPVRGLEGVKETVLEVPEFGELRIAVIAGTANAKRFFEEAARDADGAVVHHADGSVKRRYQDFHFIEVMACLGGCLSGGGQPKSALPPSDVVRNPRTRAIYTIDEHAAVRMSHMNPQIKVLYDDFLGEPCGETAHNLLHGYPEDYRDRSMHLTAKR